MAIKEVPRETVGEGIIEDLQTEDIIDNLVEVTDAVNYLFHDYSTAHLTDPEQIAEREETREAWDETFGPFEEERLYYFSKNPEDPTKKFERSIPTHGLMGWTAGRLTDPNLPDELRRNYTKYLRILEKYSKPVVEIDKKRAKTEPERNSRFRARVIWELDLRKKHGLTNGNGAADAAAAATKVEVTKSELVAPRLKRGPRKTNSSTPLTQTSHLNNPYLNGASPTPISETRRYIDGFRTWPKPIEVFEVPDNQRGQSNLQFKSVQSTESSRERTSNPALSRSPLRETSSTSTPSAQSPEPSAPLAPSVTLEELRRLLVKSEYLMDNDPFSYIFRVEDIAPTNGEFNLILKQLVNGETKNVKLSDFLNHYSGWKPAPEKTPKPKGEPDKRGGFRKITDNIRKKILKIFNWIRRHVRF